MQNSWEPHQGIGLDSILQQASRLRKAAGNPFQPLPVGKLHPLFQQWLQGIDLNPTTRATNTPTDPMARPTMKDRAATGVAALPIPFLQSNVLNEDGLRPCDWRPLKRQT